MSFFVAIVHLPFLLLFFSHVTIREVLGTESLPLMWKTNLKWERYGGFGIYRKRMKHKTKQTIKHPSL